MSATKPIGRGSRRHTIAAIIIALCSSLTVRAQLNLSERDEGILRTTFAGYVDHRESFEYFTCRFEITKGIAPSREDAIAGRYATKGEKVSCRMAVDGKRMALEITADPKAIERAIKRANAAKLSYASSSVASEGHLADTGFQFNYDPIGSGMAQVNTADIPGTGPEDTPFSIGFLSYPDIERLEKSLRRAEAGLNSVRVDPPEQWQGATVTPIGFGKPKGPIATRFSFEPQRGYLIRRAEAHDVITGNPVGQAFLTDVEACSKGRHFPTRWIWVMQAPPGAGCLFTEMKVLEYHVDRRPTREELSIHVKGGTRITYKSDMSSFRTRQDEQVHADDLKRIIELCQGRQTNPLMDTAIMTPETARWHWEYVAVPTVVILAAALWLRHRRRMAAGLSGF